MNFFVDLYQIISSNSNEIDLLISEIASIQSLSKNLKRNICGNVYFLNEDLKAINEFGDELYQCRRFYNTVIDFQIIKKIDIHKEFNSNYFYIEQDFPLDIEKKKVQNIHLCAFEDLVKHEKENIIVCNCDFERMYVLKTIRAKEIHNILMPLHFVPLCVIKTEFILSCFLKEYIIDNNDFKIIRKDLLSNANSFLNKQVDDLIDFFPFHTITKKIFKGKREKTNRARNLMISNIIATLNGLKFDELLTERNKRDKRINQIYRAPKLLNKQIYYFSLDGENGCIEIYNHLGEHENKVYGIESGIITSKKNYKISIS